MRRFFFENKPAHYLQVSQFQDLRGSSVKFFQDESSIPLSQALINRTSRKGTLRGLHTQLGEMAEEKIIYCIAGELIWFAVNYGDYNSEGVVTTDELRLKHGEAIYIPRHHLNGMISLSDDVSLLILASRPFDHKTGVNVSPFDGLFFGKSLDSFDIDKEQYAQKTSMISQQEFLEALVSNAG